MPALGETIWDQTVARRMYDQGATFVEIGACVGTGANVVSAFAKRHWPRREARPAMSRPRAALMVFGAKAIDLSLHEGQ